MKRYLFAIVCLLMVSSAVFAQPQRPNRATPEESAKRTTEWMKTELKLTPEQVAPIDSVNLVFALAQAKLFESANGDFASIREAAQKLNELRIEAYEPILTKEQMAAYKKLMEERMQNRGGQGQGQGQGQRRRTN